MTSNNILNKSNENIDETKADAENEEENQDTGDHPKIKENH